MADVWLACHGPLSCNSGQHVAAIAAGLAHRGHRPTICVPERSGDDRAVAESARVLTFGDAARAADISRPDLVHLWTPRERMRRFLDAVHRRHGPVPHLVHLEDNESLLLRQQLRLLPHETADVADGLRPLDVPDHLAHPQHARNLIAAAAGVTALIESLVAEVPAGVPVAVFRPGFDPAFAAPRPAATRDVRRRLGIADGTALVAYTGNVHAANVEEVRSLYLAVALANRTGLAVTLVRTGVDHVPLADQGLAELRRHTIELGCVPRADLPDLVHAADVLVQPGRADDWNACRVPSKLPEWLVSGRPVILPRVNLGVDLDHGRTAIVLEEATAEGIVAALRTWLPQRDQLAAIGAAGREHALESLTWAAAADAVAELYDRVLHAAAAP
jgi:glycosyltransferase involved in cell wall biosynthesis